MKDFIDKIGAGPFFIGITLLVSALILGLMVVSRGDEPSVREKSILEIATAVGLDEDQFLEDYRSDAVRNKVSEDFAEASARQNGSPSTPAIFFDGVKISNPDSYENYQVIIQQALAQRESEEKLLIEVFEDYQCPFCAVVFPMSFQAKAEFKDSVEIVHRHSPLKSIHPLAESYAWGAEAARMQGKFFDFSKAVFEKESGNDYSSLDELDFERY